jgi:hypothetical protein
MGLLRRAPARVAGRRVAPWLILLGLSREARDHWTAQLTPRQRKRLVELLRRSGGRPSTLSPREQREFHQLVARLDLKGLAKHAAGTAVTGSRKHRRGTRGR